MDEIKLTLNPTVAAPEAATAVAAAEEAISEADTIVQQVQADTANVQQFSEEEQKMIDESRKILSLPELRVTATTVRVPVYHGHSESINIEFERPFELSELRALLDKAPGLVVQDDVANNVYPMAIHAADTDPVYVGRIRRDFSVENGINLWCVADNIRKGAATNAVQIAQELIRQWEA